MCMEDIRLGRALATQAKVQTLAGVTDEEVLPADPNRTRIVFSGDGVNSIGLGCQGFRANATQGFILTPTHPQMTITIEVWGNIICAPWRAMSSAAGAVLATMAATLEKR